MWHFLKVSQSYKHRHPSFLRFSEHQKVWISLKSLILKDYAFNDKTKFDFYETKVKIYFFT